MENHPDIQRLGKVAELNLCNKCKVTYKRIIEPRVIGMMTGYFYYWKDVEWRITTMIMIFEGVYKDTKSGIIIALEPHEEVRYADEMDVKKFRNINKKPFQWKINYLKKKGILGDYSYRLLNDLRLRRNKIHRPYRDFTSDDLIAFSQGSNVVFQIWMTFQSSFGKEQNEKIRMEAEKLAEHYLRKK